MTTFIDIRDTAYVDHGDVIGLNFIDSCCPYIFRRYYRQGLRSHILEILLPDDVKREADGVIKDGIFHFPKARPVKMLRIFKTRFDSFEEIQDEITRFKITERYLSTDYIARSTEVIIDYGEPQRRSPLLCGFQEYVPGVILDPWSMVEGDSFLQTLYETISGGDEPLCVSQQCWMLHAKKHGAEFVRRVKEMIVEGGHVPDLAGLGNVLLTASGRMKLVDINNISKVYNDDTIRLDDRGYPVCDKSIEALSLIEKKVCGSTGVVNDPVYGNFLSPSRKKRVEAIEKEFFHGFCNS